MKLLQEVHEGAYYEKLCMTFKIFFQQSELIIGFHFPWIFEILLYTQSVFLCCYPESSFIFSQLLTKIFGLSYLSFHPSYLTAETIHLFCSSLFWPVIYLYFLDDSHFLLFKLEVLGALRTHPCTHTHIIKEMSCNLHQEIKRKNSKPNERTMSICFSKPYSWIQSFIPE